MTDTEPDMTLGEAAKALKISQDALRKRLLRKKIAGYKNSDGTWRVALPSYPDKRDDNTLISLTNRLTKSPDTIEHEMELLRLELQGAREIVEEIKAERNRLIRQVEQHETAEGELRRLLLSLQMTLPARTMESRAENPSTEIRAESLRHEEKESRWLTFRRWIRGQ